MADNTAQVPELPNVTFTLTYGSGGIDGMPSNTVRVVATRPGIPTEDNPNPEPIVLRDTSFIGP
ncbi:hypothetical protein SEA_LITTLEMUNCHKIN_30 [Gordonia phage LittleMunchkin]|nr:hypothetical protein SEA_YAGO84_28 [Gordonia phage Yago84]QIG58956.1 hypothetical protein SEA_ANCLAR_29 [Gordonia phage AnClar]WAB09206.1 hypothetical protein SEA_LITTLEMUNCHKIN_30 [Gordonia phage LittleMunchkin]WIC90010.1 hypothetical protein SEA_SISKO_28 [Gordonia phage Sisko]